MRFMAARNFQRFKIAFEYLCQCWVNEIGSKSDKPEKDRIEMGRGTNVVDYRSENRKASDSEILVLFRPTLQP